MWQIVSKICDATDENGNSLNYFISNTEAGEWLNKRAIYRKILSICGGNDKLLEKLYGNPVDA